MKISCKKNELLDNLQKIEGAVRRYEIIEEFVIDNLLGI